jgi:hypothetical protein
MRCKLVRRGRFLPLLSIVVVLMICLPSLTGTAPRAHAASGPDLTVDSIWLEENSAPGQAVAAVAPGDEFLIVASIKNIGDATASGYYLDVYYDSDYGRGGPDNIAAGEVQTWYVGPLTAQAGTHTTKWIVDPDNQIVESDEANNERDYTFTIGSQTTTSIITSSSSSTASSGPVVTVPADMTVEATGSSGAVVTFTASALDGEGGSLTPTCTPASGSTFSFGTTEVTCSATDSTGNAGSAFFNVIVQDSAAPVVTVPADMTVEATGSTGAVVTFTATASDVVDGSLAPTCTPSSGSTFALGSTGVTCSAADKAGNAASASFKVNVLDKTPPKLTLPADMTVQAATGASGAVVKYSVSASDLVDGSVPVTCTPASGSTFPLGTTAVSCSAKDKAGNTASGSFKVNIPAVTVTSLASNGKGLSGGVVQYYSGGWKSFGTTGSDGTVRMALAAGTYNFQITWAGASQQKSQNVGTNANVVFQTTLVTMKLLSSTNSQLSGGAKYYAGSWKTFGSGTTTTTMELLPLTYNFQITYAGATQQKSQNVATNAVVSFQTVQVHSDSGKCTSYYAGGWKTFSQDMQLLPGTYTFRFSDKTRDTSYTLVVGAVKHIH